MSRWVVHKAMPWAWGAFQIGSRRETLFLSWREAISFVDEQTRSVTVPLPRSTVLPTPRHVVWRNGVIVEIRKSELLPKVLKGHLVVEPDERKPLALALLALHYQQEEEEK